MKRLILSVMLLVFAASTFPLQAQTNPGQVQLDSLQKLDKYQKHVIDSLDKEFEQNKDIDKQLTILSDSLKKLQEKHEKQRCIYDSLIKVVDSLGPKYKAQVKRNGELETYKNQVGPLVSRQLSQMATTLDAEWLSKTYAEVDKAKLQKELELYEAFKDTDQGVGKAYVKLKAFSDDAALYRQGEEAVNSPYEAQRVSTLVQSMGALAKREIHSGRKQEVELVYGQLKDYKSTVHYFQEDIIPEVDKILSNNKKSKKEAWKYVKEFLDTGDGGMIDQYLTKIPWIGQQYYLYIKQLENDPFGKNEARQTIMDLKP